MRILIPLLLAMSASVFAAPVKSSDFSMGFAMESRAQKDVNPDYVNARFVGQLFAKLRLAPFAVLLETGREERDSSSSSLNVHSESTLLAAWGRYEFHLDREWTPYGALGFGNYFDKISTSFQGSAVNRTGNRGFLGAAAGVSTLLWGHVVLEGEGRMESVQQAKEPVFAGLIRVGCQM